MTQGLEQEMKHEEKILLPKIDIDSKENVGQYFKLLIGESPRLKFDITDKEGKEIYSNILNVELR